MKTYVTANQDSQKNSDSVGHSYSKYLEKAFTQQQSSSTFIDTQSSILQEKAYSSDRVTQLMNYQEIADRSQQVFQLSNYQERANNYTAQHAAPLQREVDEGLVRS